MYEGTSKQSSDLKNYTAHPGSEIPGSATTDDWIIQIFCITPFKLKNKPCQSWLYNWCVQSLFSAIKEKAFRVLNKTLSGPGIDDFVFL